MYRPDKRSLPKKPTYPCQYVPNDAIPRAVGLAKAVLPVRGFSEAVVDVQALGNFFEDVDGVPFVMSAVLVRDSEYKWWGLFNRGRHYSLHCIALTKEEGQEQEQEEQEKEEKKKTHL